MTYGVQNQIPGIATVYESVEGIISWAHATYTNYFRFSGVIDGGALDESHTANTSILRPGLLMGYHVANQVWVPYDDEGATVAANAGGEIQAVFMRPLDTTINGTATDRWGGYLLRPGAPIKWSALWTNQGTAGKVDAPHADAAAIRTRLEALGYQLDDWYEN